MAGTGAAMGGVTLWLTGDVMTGRGIDQVLPHPGDPRIFESYMTSALDYVRLAERVTGPIPHPVDFAYVWGDSLAWLERQAPDLRLINLETSVTTSDDAEPKGIQYRMHPANLPVLADPAREAVSTIAADVARGRESGELALVSLHWGGNWGYAIPDAHRVFAHRLIDEAGVDLVWGHSSHHALGIEVYRGRLILYGCGDLINDYEGITGHEVFRDDLALLYFPTLCAADGRLERLVMVPLQRRHFRLNRAPSDEAEWLCRMLNREGRPLGTRVRHNGHGQLVLEWQGER